MMSRRVLLAAGLDALAVLVFVVIGREEHDEGITLGGIVETAAPFLIGLAVGWLVARAWRRPLSVASGLVIWPTTVLVGMIVRNWGFDEGTATSFVIVTMAFLGMCFVGWRLIALSVMRRQSSGGALRLRYRKIRPIADWFYGRRNILLLNMVQCLL